MARHAARSSTCTSRRRSRTPARRSRSRCSCTRGSACARRGRRGGVVLLGRAAALMAMVREQDVFFAAGPAVDFAAVARARRRGAAQAGARSARWRPGGGVRGRLPAAAARLQRAQRASRADAPRDAQDDVECAARAPGAGVAGARVPRVDAARGAGDRGARRWLPRAGARADARRVVRARAAADDRAPGLRRRQRRVVDGGGRVRPAALRRRHGPPRARAGARGLSRRAARWRAGASAASRSCSCAWWNLALMAQFAPG